MRSRARRSRGTPIPRYPAITEKKLEPQLQRADASVPQLIDRSSPVEDLGVSVRTRNALRGTGCDTVGDVLGLDLSSAVRGLGRKTKDEVLTALKRAGFRHPAMEQQPASEIRIVERSLDKMQGRVDAALGAVAREIRLLRQKLRKVAPNSNKVAPNSNQSRDR